MYGTFSLSNNMHPQTVKFKKLAKKVLRKFLYWNRRNVNKVLVLGLRNNHIKYNTCKEVDMIVTTQEEAETGQEMCSFCSNA